MAFLTVPEKEKMRVLESKRNKLRNSVAITGVLFIIWLSFVAAGLSRISVYVPPALSQIVLLFWLVIMPIIIYHYAKQIDEYSFTFKERTYRLFLIILKHLEKYNEGTDIKELLNIKSIAKSFIRSFEGESFEESGFNFDKNKIKFYENLISYLEQFTEEINTGAIKTGRSIAIAQEIQNLKKYLETENFKEGTVFLEKQIHQKPTGKLFILFEKFKRWLVFDACPVIVPWFILFYLTYRISQFASFNIGVESSALISLTISGLLKAEFKKLFRDIILSPENKEKTAP